MTNIVDQEAQRTRWRRALSGAGLDRDDREDFATGGLASRLTNITTQILLLPADPEADAITIDETLATSLQTRQSVALDRIIVALPGNPRRTAHALALADSYNEAWNSYLAIHRSGAIEFGLGDRGGWDGQDRSGNPVRLITLTPAVARVGRCSALPPRPMTATTSPAHSNSPSVSVAPKTRSSPHSAKDGRSRLTSRTAPAPAWTSIFCGTSNSTSFPITTVHATSLTASGIASKMLGARDNAVTSRTEATL
jgi:hypothetical protein